MEPAFRILRAATVLAVTGLLIVALPSAGTVTGGGSAELVESPTAVARDADLPAVSQAPDPERDFEALAGSVGHAEAWHRVYGQELETQPPAGEPLPETRISAQQTATGALTHTVYLPLAQREETMPMVEQRAIWITRYDWTQSDVAPLPEKLDAMVAQIAAAGFNTVFFQVRAAGDAYYTPGLEPWAARLSGGPVSETLGLDPGWDPLARMISVGHAAGLEVHAYVNVYTAWLSPPESQGELWPPATTPPQMFDRFTYGPDYASHPGTYGLGFQWRQYGYDEDAGLATAMPLARNQYLWATPGRDEVNAYIAAVVRDIVQRYDVDGVHLDLVRYAGPEYSYDPASNATAGATKTPARDQWQRERITVLVRQIRTEAALIRPGTLVSAAVWPIYIDRWDWGRKAGYTDYYQDSKGWLSTEAVDAIVPMMYGVTGDDPVKWGILLDDFMADSEGRAVYPGIGGQYTDFNDIAWRIQTARAAGARGHAIFSYSALNANGYWDDLASGPYQTPAVLP